MRRIERTEFHALTCDFLARQRGGERQVVALSADSDLFESGYVDSLTFLNLVLFVEEALGTEIALSQCSKDDFRTIGKMYDTFAWSYTVDAHARS